VTPHRAKNGRHPFLLLATLCSVPFGFPVDPAASQDRPKPQPLADSPFAGSLGARTWFSTGQTGKTLYDFSGAGLVSRLTYDDLDGRSLEAFGELDLYRVFLKGNAGIGGLVDGSLQDEDFEPFTFPYSSTDSAQKGGDLAYATIDLGAYFVDTERVKLSGFAGYNWLHQQVNAFGCEQTTASFICLPTIPEDVAVISQENDWQSLRLGLKAEADLGRYWTVSAEGAWLPIVTLDGADTHHLRICEDFGCFTGPIPEDGRGDGYQLEGMLEFRPTERISLGLGGRYWHMETSGDTHFEDHVIGFDAGAQPVDWSVDIFGILAQAKVRF
jgi:hypothetical protein